MRLKILKSKDLEELSDSMYEHLSKLFIFLSSFIASITVGWLAFLLCYKSWIYFGILQPYAEGLSLGVCLIFPIFYSTYNSKFVEGAESPKTQFKRIVVHLLWVFLALTIVLNLYLLVPTFRSFYDFFLSLVAPTI